MEHVIGLDMVKEVNNYISHPLTESRNIRADEIDSAILNTKQEYLDNLNKAANKLSRQRCYSIEDRYERDEQIGELFWEMNTFEDLGFEDYKFKLMRFKPRVDKAELYLHIENRQHEQLLKYMNIAGLNTIEA